MLDDPQALLAAQTHIRAAKFLNIDNLNLNLHFLLDFFIVSMKHWKYLF